MEKAIHANLNFSDTFCTIVDKKNLPFAHTLFFSAKKFDKNISLQVLIVDSDLVTITDQRENIIYHPIKSVLRSEIANKIYNKYSSTNIDHLRWALKPIFLIHLLQLGYKKVIFVDPDVFFVGAYHFLFSKLDHSNILLTPHWSNIDPLKSENSLYSILIAGLYNAGFVASNSKGIKALTWWAEVCHYKMDRQKELGVFDDQRYLDILPIEFDGVEILKHRGCNLACWNIDTCQRKIVNGKLLINEFFEPIFIHFNQATIQHIVDGFDPHLKNYFDEYKRILNEYGVKLNDFKNVYSNKILFLFQRLKGYLLIRTRLKRFLFQQAEKL